LTTRPIAALFVQTNGMYYGLDGVDPWDEKRDARLYDGPYPVVAHPPCSRWCVPLAYVNQTRYGHKVGDDGGCFKHALACVRRFGGVLEHPASSVAWRHFGLTPPHDKAWSRCFDGGWVCEVAQSAYEHRARKLTWLYMFGGDPISLNWAAPMGEALVSSLTRSRRVAPRLSKKEASRTPLKFRDVLISVARSVRL